MTTFTKQQQAEYKSELERKEHYMYLTAIHDKIMNGLNANKNRSGERAIWELMQNARDLAYPQGVNVAISLDENYINFTHDGQPFDNESLNGLVTQQSTKRSGDKEIAGQYGTGFMSTHVFSRKVYVSGECKLQFQGTQTYVSLPENFCLDRTKDDLEEFNDELDREINSIKNLISLDGHDAPAQQTTFCYPLTKEKREKVSQQLMTTTKLMPYVLVFNDRIASCTITNKVLRKCIKFTRKTTVCLDDELHMTEIEADDKLLKIYWIASESEEDRIVIPPLPSGFDNTTEIPSEFLWFPMLGTEDVGVNFIYHSSRLYPVEQRNSYQLPEDNDATREKWVSNEKVLLEMTDMLFKYYRDHTEQQNLPLDFARVNFPCNVDDNETKRFMHKMQDKFTTEYLSWKMIPTRKGYRAVVDSNVENEGPLYVLGDELYQSLSDEQQKTYAAVLSSYAAKTGYIIPKDNIIEWSKIVSSWDKDKNKAHYISAKDICESIGQADERLHDFLVFLHLLGETGIKLMADYPLIPNKEGNLCKAKELMDAPTITPELYKLAKPLVEDHLERLVSAEYKDVYQFGSYTRKDLQSAVGSFIQELSRNTITSTDRKSLNEYAKKTNSELELRNLIEYCSAFSVDQPSDLRFRIMNKISSLYHETFALIYIPKVSDDEPDLYTTTFNYLLGEVMYEISLKDKSWLEDNRKELIDYVSEYSQSNNETYLDRLDKFGILPNQLGQFCLKKDLKINRGVTDELIDLYKNVFDENLREQLVDDDFAGFYDFEEITPQQIGSRITEKLENDKFQSPVVLDIIHKLDTHPDWKESVFKSIAERRYVISFGYGDKEEQDAIYKIRRQGTDKVKRMAEIVQNKNFDQIMSKAEELIKTEEEQQRQFAFKYTIGKVIEDAVREEIGGELEVEFAQSLDVVDQQAGQDIIIKRDAEPVYYIECKSKWSFAEPAHMSSLQVKQAVREKDRYALICIDCTENTGCRISMTAEQSELEMHLEEILAHTSVLTDIGHRMESVIAPLVKEENEKVDEESSIRIYSDLHCNIPKKIFISGITFHDFMEDLAKKLRN